MKNIKYDIHIKAPKQKVWEIMIQPATYKEWTNAAWPGAYYIGKWAQGEKIKFVSRDGSGTLAAIEEFDRYNYIGARHIAILLKDVEDSESDVAKGWIGTLETYTFREENGETDLTVSITTQPDWQKMFDDGFPKGLQKLKEICEQ